MEYSKRGLTDLQGVGGPVHCMDQLQVHALHVLELQLWLDQVPN